ncbi:MAG: DUF47 family protein [Metallosphaera yellowstonensis]|uniref:Phosphate transport regulator related to PhoU n=1 Tax=Metallosphaera yellowstonensis MK1 TaxID=671065 RepID=H2C7S7_9CREN|nr:DUF47 family protein [Metallosphaera yellowstonensis]EHP68203.1 phosphate transport regulator related to PhoU [Metallosphaera yellowstonensis MK1]
MLKFSINKEEVIFSKTFEIAKSIDESILKLQDLVKKVLEGDRGSLSADLVKIKAIYERVAMTREEVVSLLYGEAFLPDFKESMMMLNQALYNTIKAVKDSARAISSRRPDGELLKALGEGLQTYLSTILEAGEKLVTMVSLMKSDMREAIRVGKEIQLLERNGDDIKDVLMEKLYEAEKSTDIISLLQLKDVVIFMDDILDYMEEASLSIETLYATLKA